MLDERYRTVLDARTRRPESIAEAAAQRTRPVSVFNEHGRLMMIAADHPARGALRAGERALAMADRVDLLDRLCLALSRPGVNGVLGTPDVLEDLLLLGALDGKVVVGSMNRGGLAGTVFEIDDHRLMAMVEPFISHRVDGRVRIDLGAEATIRAMTVAAGIGNTSAYTWLKVPVVEEMERVMAATTLPALLLGGEVSSAQDAAFESWRKALKLPTVQGLVIGRSLLYPPDDDVAAAVDTAVGLLQEGQ
jgi:DhnA family fructose-bisphosphate aldolase class Ia